MRLLQTTLVIGLAAVAVGGCGQDRKQLADACTEGPETILSALATAPTDVALADGTLLSQCISGASNNAQIQEVGIAFTAAADKLATEATGSDAAALRLGFLIGAARSGASKANGVQTELLRRLEQTVGVDGPAPDRLGAYSRGLRAGVDRG